MVFRGFGHGRFGLGAGPTGARFGRAILAGASHGLARVGRVGTDDAGRLLVWGVGGGGGGGRGEEEEVLVRGVDGGPGPDLMPARHRSLVVGPGGPANSSGTLARFEIALTLRFEIALPLRFEIALRFRTAAAPAGVESGLNR